MFRRAPAVRDVVQGHRRHTVLAPRPLTAAARRTWVPRLAHHGVQGLAARPRPGRPPNGTGALAQHLQLPPRPLRQRPIPRAASRQRPAWGPSRAGSRLTHGGGRRVIDAGHSGPAPGGAQRVPPGAPAGWRPERPHGRARWGHPGTAVVLGADRRSLHQAQTLASPLAHGHEPLRGPGLPAPWGHPLNPLAGFWRVLQDLSGAGRCWPALQQLSHRTRRGLMAQHERPISAFHWGRFRLEYSGSCYCW